METEGGAGGSAIWKKLALIGVGVGIGVASSYCFCSLRNSWWGSRAEFYLESGNVAHQNSDFHVAIAQYQEALRFIQRMNEVFPNYNAAFDCYVGLATCYRDTFQFTRCRSMLDICKSTYMDMEVFHHFEQHVSARTLSVLLSTCSHSDIRFAKQLLSVLHARGIRSPEDLYLRAYSLMELGASFEEMREFQEALDCYLQCEALLTPTADVGVVANIMLGLARTYYFLGDHAKAAEKIQAVPSVQGIGSRVSKVYLRLGNLEKAKEILKQGLQNSRQQEQIDYSLWLGALADFYTDCGMEKKATKILSRFKKMTSLDAPPSLSMFFTIFPHMFVYRLKKDDPNHVDILFQLVIRPEPDVSDSVFLEVHFETSDADHPMIVEQPFDVAATRKQFWKFLILKSPPVTGLIRAGNKFEARIHIFKDETKQKRLGMHRQLFACDFPCPSPLPLKAVQGILSPEHDE